MDIESTRPLDRLQRMLFNNDLLRSLLYNFADLSHSFLEKSDLNNCSALNCDFTDVRMIDVVAKNANFSRSQFVKASITASQFDSAILQATNFEHSLIVSSSFDKALLIRTNLRFCLIDDVTFASTTLEMVDFGQAQITKTSFAQANLSHSQLYKVFIEATRFESINIVRCHFRFCQFARCSFVNAKIMFADFLGCTFIRCDFTQATLIQSSLQSCSFIECNFANATLERCQVDESAFQNISFANTSFVQSSVANTIFANVDFRDAIALETITHRKSSTIGLDSLYRTRHLPIHSFNSFLANAGVPDIFLTYLPELIMAKHSSLFLSCFISYSSRDRIFANRLHDELEKRGISVFLDIHELAPGDFIREGIQSGISQRDKVLICVSRNSLTKSFWVDEEVTATLQKEEKVRRETGKKVSILIPLDLDGFLFEEECQSAVKPQLISRVVADFRGWEADPKIWQSKLADLVTALKSKR